MNNPYHQPWPHTPAVGAVPGQQPVPPQPAAFPGNPYAAQPYPVSSYYGPGAPLMAAPMAPAPTGSVLTNSRFIKGALVGGLAAYLLTNENIQQSAIKGAVKVWSLLQGGLEEMKERFRDAEAELHAAQAQEDD